MKILLKFLSNCFMKKKSVFVNMLMKLLFSAPKKWEIKTISHFAVYYYFLVPVSGSNNDIIIPSMF